MDHVDLDRQLVQVTLDEAEPRLTSSKVANSNFTAWKEETNK